MIETNFLGSNLNQVKAHNLQAILLRLLHEEQLSRVQLARRTNLSSTTITNLVTELIERGLVVEDCNTPDEEEPRGVGRPRTGLCLAPNARYAIGIHIGVGLFRVALVNLRAEILHNRIVQFAADAPALEVIEQMAAAVETLLAAAGVAREALLGVGVGASGLVTPSAGVIHLAPNLGWHEVPIRALLQNRLRLPVTLDNNVRAMALGEAYFGSGRGAQSLAFVYGRVGVGAGFVVDGQLFRGSHTGAGEIGHTIIVPENGLLCRCGRRGCLETLVSERVLLEQAAEIAARHPDGRLERLLAAPGENAPIECIFQAAREGDADACRLIERQGYYLGIALANLVNVLNPQLIVLGGMFAQGADLIQPVAERVIRQMAFANLGEKVRLATTPFGWRAGVTGAAALALLHFFYQPASGSFAAAATN